MGGEPLYNFSSHFDSASVERLITLKLIGEIPRHIYDTSLLLALHGLVRIELVRAMALM